MPSWILSFSLESRWEALRPALGGFLNALLGAPEWSLVKRAPLRDKNGSRDTFSATWQAGQAQLQESIRSGTGTGDPREGYGYDLELILSAPELHVTLTSSAWTLGHSRIHVTLKGSAQAFQGLRRALAPLGQDTTDQPYYAVTNCKAASDDPVLRRSLLDAALAYGPPGCAGWTELLALAGTTEGAAPTSAQ